MGKPVYLLDLTALAWLQYLRSGGPDTYGTWVFGNTRVPVDLAKTYRITLVCRKTAAANGTLYGGVAQFNSSGTYIGTLDNVAVSGSAGSTSWTTYTITFGFGTAHTLDAAATGMSPNVILNYGNTAGAFDCRELWIEDTSAAGVAISADRHMRDPSEWNLWRGVPGDFRTLLGADVETLTLRYATSAYITAAADTPAKTQYDARVQQPGLLRMELPAGFGGSITASYGQIVLDNSDGALGDLAYYGLDGQAFTLRYGQDDAALSTFSTLMAGTMQQATVDRKTVTIRLAGRDAMLDKPLCRDRYGGTNALPNGLDGGPELTGQVKPVAYGLATGIQPPCVNTARFIYQVASILPSTAPPVLNVRDAGVLLTAGAAYTSQADMEANAPAAGQYRVWAGNGCFRLGTTPAGVVTCDVDATLTGFSAADPWWNVLYQMATDSGIGSAEIQFSHSYASPAADNWGGAAWPTDQPPLGLWSNDPRLTVRQAMNQVTGSMVAWYGFIHWSGSPGSAMKFGGEVFPPTSTGLSVSTQPSFDLSNLLSAAAIADPGAGRGVPVWSVELGYAQNNTVLTPSMAPSVSPLALGVLALKNLRLSAANGDVLAKNPSAIAVVRETVLAGAAANVAYEATRELELHRYTKLWFEVRASMSAVLDQAYRPRLGGYVYLSWPTLKVLWQDGVTRSNGWFTVMAIELDFARGEVRMTLRQATEQSI